MRAFELATSVRLVVTAYPPPSLSIRSFFGLATLLLQQVSCT